MVKKLKPGETPGFLDESTESDLRKMLRIEDGQPLPQEVIDVFVETKRAYDPIGGNKLSPQLLVMVVMLAKERMANQPDLEEEEGGYKVGDRVVTIFKDKEHNGQIVSIGHGQDAGKLRVHLDEDPEGKQYREIPEGRISPRE